MKSTEGLSELIAVVNTGADWDVTFERRDRAYNASQSLYTLCSGRGSQVPQDIPPKMESIDYEIIVDTDESEQRLELLHENVKKYGTVFNTVAPGTVLSGVLRRK